MVSSLKNRQFLIFPFLILILVGSIILLLSDLIPIQVSTESLPSPDLKGYLPLSSAISSSNNTLDLKNHVIELKEISQILWAMQGITHDSGHRTVPSAGATYPLEIFLIQKNSGSLKGGCFIYRPHEHQLKRISSSYNASMLLSSVEDENLEAVANVSTIFFILADYRRTTDRYSSPHSFYPYRGVQYVHLEVGHTIQNFLLQLVSLRLNTRIITDFSSQVIQTFLNTTLDPMVILPVGIDAKPDIPLIKPKRLSLLNEDEMSVEEAILKRKSIRDYLDGKIPLSVVFDLMNDSTTIPNILRNKPQLDIRLVMSEIEDIPAGLYQYFNENYSLNQLSLGDFRSTLKEAGLNQIWIENAQLDIIISLNTNWINQQSDPIFFHRTLLYEIGMIAQNIYLKCASYGLGTVVVGAFYESLTSQVVDLPNDYTPIYIIPVGLTNEFFEHTTELYIPLTDLARIWGLLVYIPFYVTLYLSLPILRRRMANKLRWIHCICGIIPLVVIIFHFMIMHGHVQTLGDFLSLTSYSSSFIGFIRSIFSFPTTRYHVGMFAATLAALIGILIATTGIIVAFKLIKKRRFVRRIHKYSMVIILVLMILHAFLNGTIFAFRPTIFLLLNLLVLDIYYLIYLYPNFVKTIREFKIQSKNSIEY